MTRNNRSDIAGVLALSCYRAAAQSFMCAVECLQEENTALSQNQAVTILTVLMQGLDGLREELRDTIELDEKLSNLGSEAL